MKKAREIFGCFIEIVGGVSALGIADPKHASERVAEQPTEDPQERRLNLEVLELCRMYGAFAAWLLWAVMLLASALGHASLACSLEGLSKFALACVLLAYATVASLTPARPLARGAAACAAFCALLACGDAALAVSPATIAAQIARAAAYLAAMEMTCAVGDLKGVAEDRVASGIREVGLVVFATRIVSLITVRDGRSAVHVSVGMFELMWLCAITWSQFRHNRVGRGRRTWPPICAGFLLVALGRSLEGFGSLGGFGAGALRAVGLIYAVVQYAALCSGELRGTDTVVIQLERETQ
jgi:hypothetical protein